MVPLPDQYGHPARVPLPKHVRDFIQRVQIDGLEQFGKRRRGEIQDDGRYFLLQQEQQLANHDRECWMPMVDGLSVNELRAYLHRLGPYQNPAALRAVLDAARLVQGELTDRGTQIALDSMLFATRYSPTINAARIRMPGFDADILLFNEGVLQFGFCAVDLIGNISDAWEARAGPSLKIGSSKAANQWLREDTGGALTLILDTLLTFVVTGSAEMSWVLNTRRFRYAISGKSFLFRRALLSWLVAHEIGHVVAGNVPRLGGFSLSQERTVRYALTEEFLADRFATDYAFVAARRGFSGIDPVDLFTASWLCPALMALLDVTAATLLSGERGMTIAGGTHPSSWGRLESIWAHLATSADESPVHGQEALAALVQGVSLVDILATELENEALEIRRHGGPGPHFTWERGSLIEPRKLWSEGFGVSERLRT